MRGTRLATRATHRKSDPGSWIFLPKIYFDALSWSIGPDSTLGERPLDEINQRLSTCVSGVIALAIVALNAYVVHILAAVDPLEIAGVLTIVSTVLAVIPRIIKAVQVR